MFDTILSFYYIYIFVFVMVIKNINAVIVDFGILVSIDTILDRISLLVNVFNHRKGFRSTRYVDLKTPIDFNPQNTLKNTILSRIISVNSRNEYDHEEKDNCNNMKSI